MYLRHISAQGRKCDKRRTVCAQQPWTRYPSSATRRSAGEGERRRRNTQRRAGTDRLAKCDSQEDGPPTCTRIYANETLRTRGRLRPKFQHESETRRMRRGELAAEERRKTVDHTPPSAQGQDTSCLCVPIVHDVPMVSDREREDIML